MRRNSSSRGRQRDETPLTLGSINSLYRGALFRFHLARPVLRAWIGPIIVHCGTPSDD
jgi:hypothetical protein